MGVNVDQLQNISSSFFKSGSRNHEILHVTVYIYSHSWQISETSGARTRSEVFLATLRSEVSAALGNLLTNSPNLRDLHCCFSFDLKALRNCRELRRLRLYFEPQRHWYEFLSKAKNHFQTHEYLEFFTVCEIHECERIL
ncbi:hypothetical protein AVEN_237891-1 [Araneus ventricosus]|uniref:Uncharacterized protein n=1 Tax=Araneus ventricosus TaxID=182803 RepID=A0A4Y2PTA8_ARAVE|nr:hypothetical protein AVEN_237891-1 [Araneus ventricosus]